MNWGAEINRQVANATGRELEAARSTIAELQKRIAELEAALAGLGQRKLAPPSSTEAENE